MLVVCGIIDLHNPAGNCPTQLFIYSQGFTGIDDLSMIRIKDVPHMIKDHNSVPNQDAHLGTFKQRKLQVLVWRTKDCHRWGLEIILVAWNEEELKISIKNKMSLHGEETLN